MLFWSLIHLGLWKDCFENVLNIIKNLEDKYDVRQLNVEGEDGDLEMKWPELLSEKEL